MRRRHCVESIHGEYEHVGKEWSAIREPGRPSIGPRALVNTPIFFDLALMLSELEPFLFFRALLLIFLKIGPSFGLLVLNCLVFDPTF